jgi:hypothetical protein
MGGVAGEAPASHAAMAVEARTEARIAVRRS